MSVAQTFFSWNVNLVTTDNHLFINWVKQQHLFCITLFTSLSMFSLVAELRAEGARSTMGKRNWEMHESHKFWLGYDVTSVRPSVRPPLHVSQCEMRHSNPFLQPAFLLAGSCMANCFLEK